MTDQNQNGTVFDIQHFSVSDGPGIRTVVFFKGCPLRCSWCHNPESYQVRPQIMAYREKCLNCGACAVACPQGLAGNRGMDSSWRAGCTGCGVCVTACGANALELAGTRMTVQQIMTEVLEDLPFYSHSGGGITLSGGEPMNQPVFARALAMAAKEQNLHVAMETCGYCDRESLIAIRPYIDLFLYDYKLTGDEVHHQHTGVGQQRILENLRWLDENGANIILRCPMIPGINIHNEHENGIIQLAFSLRHLKQIHLEPYHRIGESKRERLGMACMDATEIPDRSQLEAMAKRIATATGIETLVM